MQCADRSPDPPECPAPREKARDEIAIRSRRGDDRRETIDRGQPLHIRFQREHLGLCIEHAKKIARAQHQLRRRTQRIKKLRVDFAFSGRTGREVERIKIPVASDNQLPASRFKRDALGNLAPNIHHDVRGRERSVPAQVNLDARSKPAQMIFPALRNIKRSLCKIIFGRNCLHRRVGKPVVKRANSGWIASKKFAGEGIHLVDGNVHSSVSRRRRETCNREVPSDCVAAVRGNFGIRHHPGAIRYRARSVRLESTNTPCRYRFDQARSVQMTPRVGGVRLDVGSGANLGRQRNLVHRNVQARRGEPAAGDEFWTWPKSLSNPDVCSS